MKLYLLCAVVIFYMQNLRAQESAFQPSLSDQLLYGPPDAGINSIPSASKHRFMPTDVSFMGGVLWDEDCLFRNMDLASPLTAGAPRNELSLQSAVPTANLIGGLVTLGSIITATYYGQKMIDGNNNRKYREDRQLFEITTVISYSVTGLLELFSPPS